MVRTILVTGSNQGLGKHTVHQLAQTPDVIVFMGSRKLEAAEEALSKFALDIHASSSVVPVQLDITDDASIKAVNPFIADCLKEKGLSNLDVLINNAAIVGKTFAETYSVNVFGTVALTETIRPLIANGGAIIDVSATLGSLQWFTKRPPPPVFPQYMAYSSSKAALNSIALQWNVLEEGKGSNIRIVSICPGMSSPK
ncbi:short chain dehydrogenase [Mycena metata]|uniref:Short chain dehydrogenase n=1 Tax=Mycena metata TaxID=1033252 RepID=A0AAD7KGP9_9AGAR|nr:short chain dehydrogenase [Mycena metata]